MIETVARIIFEETFRDLKWSDAPQDVREELYRIARMIFAGVRKPTEEMCCAGDIASVPRHDESKLEMLAYRAERTWQGMIDEALK